MARAKWGVTMAQLKAALSAEGLAPTHLSGYSRGDVDRLVNRLSKANRERVLDAARNGNWPKRVDEPPAAEQAPQQVSKGAEVLSVYECFHCGGHECGIDASPVLEGWAVFCHACGCTGPAEPTPRAALSTWNAMCGGADARTEWVALAFDILPEGEVARPLGL